MPYVRSLINEKKLWFGELIRQYLVEVPAFYDGDDPRFQEQILIMELWLSEGASHYYEDAPYALAETVWLHGFKQECGCSPFTCYEAGYYGLDCRFGDDVLFYKDAPLVGELNCMDFWSPPAPIILSVCTAADRVAKELSVAPITVVGIMQEEHVGAREARRLITERQSSESGSE